MPRWRSQIARARRRQIAACRDRARLDQQEVVSEGVSLDERDRLYLRQNARRCQPKRRTSDRGSALKVPTNKVLNSMPFHPPCRRDFTGKRSSTIRTSRKSASSARNSPAL